MCTVKGKEYGKIRLLINDWNTAWKSLTKCTLQCQISGVQIVGEGVCQMCQVLRSGGGWAVRLKLRLNILVQQNKFKLNKRRLNYWVLLCKI